MEKGLARQENNRQLPLLVACLKRLLRARGIGYREIAQTLAVSEPTLKRWFACKGMTIERLEDLCTFADVNLIELIEITTRDADARLRQLSVEQEQALADDRNLAFVFAIILRSGSPDQLWREQGLEQAALISYLARLDNLRLIDLLPGNEMRLLTVRDVEWRKDGPMRNQVAQWIMAEHAKSTAMRPGMPWGAELVRLSDASLIRLEEMIRDFQRNIRLLGDAERNASPAPKAWYSLMIASSHIDLGGLSSKPKRVSA